MNTPANPASPKTSLSSGSDAMLDDLLAESTGKPFLGISLDDLLADSMKQRQEAESAKLSRSLLAKGGITAEARKRMEEQVRAHDMKVQWDAKAAVAMFTRQWCKDCGLVHVHFSGYFQRQKHRTSKIDRWLKSPKELLGNLPKETKYEDVEVETCEECAGAAGYPVDEYEVDGATE